MTKEMTFGGPEHYRLLLLIDQLQREGKTEEEIESAVAEATTEREPDRLAA